MLVCPNCKAFNSRGAEFCRDCHAPLPRGSFQGVAAPQYQPASKRSHPPMEPKVTRADILFVLDCTYSMRGELEAIRDTIVSFANSIQSEKVRVRVGLIQFRDRFYGEEHRVMLFEGEPFTQDPTLFQEAAARLEAVGGGDIPESSLDALMLALNQPFEAESSKVIVLITDAPPHIPDYETPSLEVVLQAIRCLPLDQIYIVTQVRNPETQIYFELLKAARGLAFDLGEGNDFKQRAEDFKQTLMSLGKTISATLKK